MQQNISLLQINKGLRKMLDSEYQFFTKDYYELVVFMLGQNNWLELKIQEQKDLIKTLCVMYLTDDDLKIICELYSSSLSIYNKIHLFENDLLNIVQHLCWAQDLYLK